MKENKNYKLIRLIEQSIKDFKLDLTDCNILLPAALTEPALAPVMASLAGAANIYVPARDIETVNKTTFFVNELDLKSRIVFIEKENPQILSGLDIVIKGEGVSYIDSDFISKLNENCVISVFPKNFDFINIEGIDLEGCAKKKIPVITVDPDDKNLMLNKYFAHLTVKRCFQANMDILNSRILLVGSGELMETILGLLKTMGAMVYAAYTDRQQDQLYILRHLHEVDTVIIADYPQKSELVIGNGGFINIGDLADINPEIRIVHISGKMEINPLAFNRVFYTPEVITQNSLNVNANDIGLRALSDTTAAVMKVAQTLIKSKNRSLLPGESQVSYNIINAEGPVVLGKIIF
ncbi:MAG: hypothetical protein PHC34_12885 [Candidatus Gastranaerophilales bacterium]|nr:hypothetical protein [Candidatus Gastranaerophilales bacterium]